MPAIYGYGGTVAWTVLFGDCDLNVKSWSLDYTADMLDTTDFSSSGDRTFIGGLRTWSGSFECNLDDTAKILNSGSDLGGTASVMSLNATSTKVYVGTATCSGIHPSVSVEGLNTVTIDFQGTGALSIT